MASLEQKEISENMVDSRSGPTTHPDKVRPSEPMVSPSPKKEPEEEKRRLSNVESISSGCVTPNLEDQDQDIDLEANPISLAPTQSGPPHSAFSPRKRKFIVFMAAFAGFFSPLSANIYFPALNTLSKDLHVSSSLINLTLTSYMIFQGLAPTFFGDLADMAGRRPAYLIGFVIYIAACIGIACQDSYAALFVLRCLQSTGSSSTIALASGVIADVSTSAERGMYMGLVTLGPMVGPAIGPVLGGVLAQFLGWRSIFWFLAILAGVFMVPFVLAFPETARNVVGDGSIPPQ
jgi:multidrug resistance protein